MCPPCTISSSPRWQGAKAGRICCQFTWQHPDCPHKLPRKGCSAILSSASLIKWDYKKKSSKSFLILKQIQAAKRHQDPGTPGQDGFPLHRAFGRGSAISHVTAELQQAHCGLSLTPAQLQQCQTGMGSQHYWSRAQLPAPG